MRVFVALSYNRDHETAVCGASDSRAEALRLVELCRNETLHFDHRATDGPDGGAAVNDGTGDCVGHVLAFDVAGTAKLAWEPTPQSTLEAKSSIWQDGGSPLRYVVRHNGFLWIAEFEGHRLGWGSIDECFVLCRKREDEAVLEAIQAKGCV